MRFLGLLFLLLNLSLHASEGIILGHRYGHLVAAEALRGALASEEDLPILMIERYKAPGLANLIEKRHLRNFVLYPERILEAQLELDKASDELNKTILERRHLFNPWALLEDLKQHNPKVIYVTAPLILHTLSELRRQGHLSHAKIVWVVTDYFQSSYWQKYPASLADHVYAPSAEWIKESESLLQKHERPIYSLTGIPVKAVSSVSKESLRAKYLKQLGLSSELPILGIAGGSSGSGNYFNRLESLNSFLKKWGTKIQVVVFCGNNQLLHQQVEALGDTYSETMEIVALGYRPDFIDIARSTTDVLLTKAGGVSLAESIMYEIPIALDPNSLGAESGNAKYFLLKGLAFPITEKNFGWDLFRVLVDDDKKIKLLETQADFREDLLGSSFIARNHRSLLNAFRVIGTENTKNKLTRFMFVRKLISNCRLYLQTARRVF